MITNNARHISGCYQLVLLIIFILIFSACDGGVQDKYLKNQKRQALKEVKNSKEFKEIVLNAGNRLLIFDLYANWCMPCKQLEPILESVAWKRKDVVDIYRINFDENRDMAELLGVRGIPFVAFVKDQTLVYSLMGLRSEKSYLEAITSFTRQDRPSDPRAANGGVRLDLDGPPTSQSPQ
jgi:thioredoxin-like negative regulator of GroEL